MSNLPKRRRNRKDCPTPAKRCFPNRAAAERAMSGALCGPTRLFVPIAAYRCKCGWHHLAHSTLYGRRP
jgi:hypothetical protein